jgi:uncharacterized membrane protein
VVGVFLLLFGLKWLYKAILRSSGLRSLHDEAKTFRETRAKLEAARRVGVDRVGISTSFGGVFLEGLEVVFIVVALGGLENVGSAIVGALASLVVVGGAGIALRRPLTQVPENTMKYVVGIMLTSFGTFFAGEGLGVLWWRDDLSLLPLIAVYGLASLLCVMFLKRPKPASSRVDNVVVRSLRAAILEIWGLFVDDGALAVIALLVLFAVGWYAEHVRGQQGIAAVLLVLGVLTAIAIGLSGPYRQSRRMDKPVAVEVAPPDRPEVSTPSAPERTPVG